MSIVQRPVRATAIVAAGSVPVRGRHIVLPCGPVEAEGRVLAVTEAYVVEGAVVRTHCVAVTAAGVSEVAVVAAVDDPISGSSTT